MATPKYLWGLELPEIRFCERFVELGSVSEAAKRCGISVRRAKKLLADDRVQSFLASSCRQAAESVGITEQYVIESLKQISEMALVERDFKAACTALELLGKHLRMFTDRLELGGSSGGPLVVQIVEEDHAKDSSS